MEHVNKLRQFRGDLYAVLPQRPAAILDLLDALASNTQARSPVELSLNALFRRQYGSAYDAVDSFFVPTTTATASIERHSHALRVLRLLAASCPGRSSASSGSLASTGRRPAAVCRDAGGSHLCTPAQYVARQQTGDARS